MTNNRKQAIAYALSLEKKLEKQKLKEGFDNEFQKFLDTKSLREIPEEEQCQWVGQTQVARIQ